jgi:1-acyl-sn-glycerol-3-phosphate acyltransferase
MNMVTVASPVLKVLFDRLGRVDVFNMPSVLQEGGPGAVIVCNHVGWADSLWLAYALYPRQLRFLSKQELFDTRMSKWLMERGGCIAIDRGEPSASSIKTVVEVLRQGEVILIFPSGTRQRENAVFKRGAATMALHAQVPIVPAFYRGPKQMRVGDFLDRPRVQVSFGNAIPTLGLTIDKPAATQLTSQLQAAIEVLGGRAEQVTTGGHPGDARGLVAGVVE